jgi:hypothetical protein
MAGIQMAEIPPMAEILMPLLQNKAAVPTTATELWAKRPLVLVRTMAMELNKL